MRRSHIPIVGSCLLVLSLCLSCDYFAAPKIVEVPKNPDPPVIVNGKVTARQYLAGTLPDYELVWKLYDLQPQERPPFLDSFVEEFTRSGNPTRGIEYRQLLLEAIGGAQFQTASDLGSRHASKAVTNEQIQGVIRSSLGVSKGVALGWKAGYIRGFAAWCVAEAARKGAVNEDLIQRFHREGATTYHALRAAIGQ
jgi:hypothetical protein